MFSSFARSPSASFRKSGLLISDRYPVCLDTLRRHHKLEVFDGLMDRMYLITP